MVKRQRVSIVVSALFAFFFLLLPAAQSAPGIAPALTVTGPVAVTGDSYPFGSVAHTMMPQNISAFGYVEEEYLVKGTANVYDLNDAGKVVVKAADAPYVTRIIVRRPALAQRFSGNVIVELLNPTAFYDLDLQWQFSRDYFMAHRDAYVGITIKPIAIKALKTFNPERYSSLSMVNPLPLEQTCPKPVSMLPDTFPETENGLVWDIVSQVGALLKSDATGNPMKGFPVKRVYATGYSQTGGYLVTYINFIRPLDSAKLPDGKPIYDGYLIGDGDGLVGLASLNQCATQLQPGDPRSIVKPRSEPVISVVGQSLLGLNSLVRRADSDAPDDRYRRYEIPGAGHVTQNGMALSPALQDVMKTGVNAPPPKCTEVAKYGMTDFPLEYFMNGAFANLDAWVRSGKAPAKAPWIKTKTVATPPSIVPEVDKYGNALGGVRSPYLDVPIATYFAGSTPEDQASGLFCSLSGYKVLFTKEVRSKLYPQRNIYMKKVAQAANELIKSRIITQSDGLKIIKEASRASAR